MAKKQKTWTVDKKVVDAIISEGGKKNRSESFIVDEILKLHFKIK